MYNINNQRKKVYQLESCGEGPGKGWKEVLGKGWREEMERGSHIILLQLIY